MRAIGSPSRCCRTTVARVRQSRGPQVRRTVRAVTRTGDREPAKTQNGHCSTAPHPAATDARPRCMWCVDDGRTVVMAPYGGDFVCPVCGNSCGTTD